MVQKVMLLKPETWRVERVDGALSLVNQNTGVPLQREPEEVQVSAMFVMAASFLLVNQLERTTGKLANHVKADPRHRGEEARLIEQNYGVLALTAPDPRLIDAVLRSSRQLELFRRAA